MGAQAAAWCSIRSGPKALPAWAEGWAAGRSCAEHSSAAPCLCLTIGICLPALLPAGFIHRLAPVVFENAFVVQGELCLALLAVRLHACAACIAGCRCCAGCFVKHSVAGPVLPCLLLLEPSWHGLHGGSSPPPPTLLIPLSPPPALAGNRPEELPEQILASARVYRVDFTKAMNFPAKSLEELGNGTGPAHDGVADR